MFSRLLADIILVIHALFIVFVTFGGLFVFRWKKILWIHLPCVLWAILLEFRGWICPLTYLENYLRRTAVTNGYSGDFIAHYLIPIVYPPGLTTSIEMLLGITALVINLVIYNYLWWYWHRDQIKINCQF